MRRRKSIALLGAAAGWPGTVLAQQTQAAHLPIVGSLIFLPGNLVQAANEAELARLGWVEGKNVIFDLREVPADRGCRHS
jgi:hypothetical protein